MTATTIASYFDDALAAEADVVASGAIQLLLDGEPAITVGRHRHQVVVVEAPAGAGKTEFVCRVVDEAITRNPSRAGVIVVGTPTNDQAFELVRRIATRIGARAMVAFAPAAGRSLPPATLALPNVAQIAARDADHYAVVVGTLDKLGDAYARYPNLAFDYLVIDEAYQADSARYYGVGHLAPRHLLVGDPGQLDPFTTMTDADRWRGSPEDPTQTAVAVVRANHGDAVRVVRLPITRRLPPSAIPVVQAFYPGHTFAAWTLPHVRTLSLIPALPIGPEARFDQALDFAATTGWGYVRLPESPVLTADPATVDVITRLAGRLAARSPRVTSERTDGERHVLTLDRVAVAVSHNDQKDQLLLSLSRAGLDAIRVDTANKLQGLEFDLVVAWHPLAGLPAPDGFHLDPGRLCVMLTRHRHACIVVGRAGDSDLLESVPPAAEAWLGFEGSPEVDGWYAHRVVFEQLRRRAVDLR
jgi:hypothetical protein